MNYYAYIIHELFLKIFSVQLTNDFLLPSFFTAYMILYLNICKYLHLSNFIFMVLG